MILGVIALTLLQAPVVPHAEVAPLGRDLLGAVEVIENHLIQMHALARAAIPPTLTAQERAKLNARYQAHTVSIDGIANSTFWHSVSLLNLPVPMLELQVHPHSDETVPLWLAIFTASALQLSGDITTASNAHSKWFVVGTAINTTVMYQNYATQQFRVVLGARPWSASTSGRKSPPELTRGRSSASTASESSSSGARQAGGSVRGPRSAPRSGSSRGSGLGSRGAEALVAVEQGPHRRPRGAGAPHPRHGSGFQISDPEVRSR